MNKFSLLNSYPFDRKVVKKLMIDLDLTVSDLLKRIPELSQATVSRYTNGMGRNPLIQQAVADALRVPLDSLFAKPSKSRTGGNSRSSSPALTALSAE